jgi:phosphatidylserine/phosphatidylglycerophosphate/cardiolipin synthase-like enzyme
MQRIAGWRRRSVVSIGSKNPDERRLIGCVAPHEDWGELQGLLATSYEFQSDFLETDFLPSVFSLGAWDDRRQTSRIAMERRLAEMTGAVILLDPHGYRTRPRSLRIEVKPAPAPSRGKLHAKILVLVHEKAVRLLVGSHNLTEPGWRKNLEISTVLTAGPGQTGQISLIREALETGREILQPWWSAAAQGFHELALTRLNTFGAGQTLETDEFVWSGPERPLWRRFLDRWPASERIKAITILSPFWSEESSSNPINRLLDILDEREQLGTDSRIRLIAETEPGSRRPQLPVEMVKALAKRGGVTIEAAAFDPLVPGEEFQTEDNEIRRQLHAKMVCVEGEKTIQTYLGSANFTRRGWGLGASSSQLNIEAGVILRRARAEREALLQLIPPIAGKWIVLADTSVDMIAPMVSTDHEEYWPAFILDCRLATEVNNPSALELQITFLAEALDGTAVILAPTEDTQPEIMLLSLQPGEQDGIRRIPLDAENLKRLLRCQELLVRWDGKSRLIPLNVSEDARDQLPMGPHGKNPGEDDLLAYFQGRISFEDLFPDDEDDPDDLTEPDKQAKAALRSQVDTRRIQSYQVREFVEALEGIRKSLTEAAAHERTMRLALLGPASPVRLAELINEANRANLRTPSAAAFQLLELIHLVAAISRLPNYESWAAHQGSALRSLDRHLDEIRTRAPELNRGDFPDYHRMMQQQRRQLEGNR